jgi:type I restriction enzyme S subunit
VRSVPLVEVALPKGLIGGPFGSSLGKKDYVSSGIPVIRGQNLAGSGRFSLDDLVFVTEAKAASELARNLAEPGDVIFTQRGTLGQVGVVPKQPYTKYVISQSQMRLRVDPDKADATYIYYCFLDAGMQDTIRSHAITTGVPHINLGILAELRVPLPPLPEQHAIAEVLGTLDDKIEANDEIVRTCSDLAAAQFRIAAQGRTSLAEVASITMGQSPPGSSYNELGDGAPFFQGTRDFGFRHPRRRVWCNAPTRFANATDSLVSVRAPVGRVNTASERCAIGRGLAAARSAFPSVLYQALTAEPWVWSPFESEGTVFGAIDKAQFAAIRLPWPTTTQDVAQLEETLARFDRLVDAIGQEDRVLASLRGVLLPKLLSGELRVRDAELLVEEAV